MENVAANSPPGQAGITENSPTSSPVSTEEATTLLILNGPAGRVIDQSATPDRSSLLSADEAQRLARIARDRANRFMVSGPDVDMLLDIITRFSK